MRIGRWLAETAVGLGDRRALTTGISPRYPAVYAAEGSIGGNGVENSCCPQWREILGCLLRIILDALLPPAMNVILRLG